MNTLTVIYNNTNYNIISVPLNMRISDLKKNIKKKLNIDKDIIMKYFNIILDDNKLIVDYNFNNAVIIITDNDNDNDKDKNYNINKIINYGILGVGLLFILK